MTIGQIKERILALAKKGLPRKPITIQDRLMQERVIGYNKALIDVVAELDNMKKDNGNK